MIHDILDLHTHTIMSGHAYSTMQEMIRSASEKDVKLLGITEHAPRIPGACHPFYFINFKVVPREQFGVKLILGCELNIIDYEGHMTSSHATSTVWTTPLPASMNHAMTSEPWRRTQRLTSVP